MDVIEKIKEKLRNYPDLSFEETSDEITILPKDSSGFEITLWRDDMEIVVFFEGWHEHFERTNEEDALNCLAFGLSDHCRLIVFSKGRKDYKWTIQAKNVERNKWEFSGTTRVFRLIKFWKKKHVRYLQNSVIKMNAEQIV